MYSKFSFFCTILLSLFLTSGCNTTKFTADSLPETQLIFGNGGGFSGMVNYYLLLENGQFFEKKNGSQSFSELAKVKKKQAKAIYTHLDSMSFVELEIEQPGNTYHFIQLATPAAEHKVTWGKRDYQVDAQVESLYKELMDLVKKSK